MFLLQFKNNFKSIKGSKDSLITWSIEKKLQELFFKITVAQSGKKLIYLVVMSTFLIWKLYRQAILTYFLRRKMYNGVTNHMDRRQEMQKSKRISVTASLCHRSAQGWSESHFLDF